MFSKYLHRELRLVVEAVQVTDDNADQVASWCGGNTVLEHSADGSGSSPGVNLQIAGGDWGRASLRDWVLLDSNGEFHAAKPGFFDRTYQLIV